MVSAPDEKKCCCGIDIDVDTSQQIDIFTPSQQIDIFTPSSLSIDISTTDPMSLTSIEVTNCSNNYNVLAQKPSINGVVLEGDKTTEELKIDCDKTYYHIQSVASDNWVIVHGLNKYPSVSVINSAGDEVVGDIIYNDTNQVTIKFKGSFKGSATLN